MKYYYLAVFLPCALLFVITSIISTKLGWRPWKKYTTLLMVFLLLLGLASFVHPNLNINRVVEVIVQNNLKMVGETTNTQALIHFQNLNSDWSSIFYNALIGCWEGLFRPYIWEGGHLFWRITAVENLLLLLLCIGAIYRLIKGGVTIRKENVDIVIVSVLYIILLAVLLPLAAPNLGSLARYKAGYYPILLFFILLCYRIPRFGVYKRT